MQLVVEDDIRHEFPDHVTTWFRPLRPAFDHDRFRAEIDALLADARARFGGKSADEMRPLLAWRDVYARMGASPKYRSSAESLFSCFSESGSLPSVHPLVDLYNTISLASLTPMAGYNLDAVSGGLSLRRARKGELFTPLGNPRQFEKTKTHEIVYADSEKVVCRYWNLRDCHETRLGPETTNIIFIADILDVGGAGKNVLESIQAALGRALDCDIEAFPIPHNP